MKISSSNANISCVVCNKNTTQFAFVGQDQMHDIPGEYSLYKCQSCRSLFLHPIPQNLAKHYPSNRYYSLKGADGMPGSGDQLFQILYSRNTPFILRVLSWPLRKVFRSLKTVDGGCFLDVGCGSGHFLVYANTYNMDCYGVDTGAFCKSFAQKHQLKIFHGEICQAQFAENFFDVITMNHTLEHIQTPQQTLQELHRILKPGGTMIIGVPQSFSLAQKIFGRHWAELDIPRHIFVCSTNSLKKLCQQQGFQITKIRYNSNPVSFIMSFIYWKNSWSRHKIYFENIDWHKKRYALLFFLLLPICYLCDLFHVGDQVEIFVTKK